MGSGNLTPVAMQVAVPHVVGQNLDDVEPWLGRAAGSRQPEATQCQEFSAIPHLLAQCLTRESRRTRIIDASSKLCRVVLGWLSCCTQGGSSSLSLHAKGSGYYK